MYKFFAAVCLLFPISMIPLGCKKQVEIKQYETYKNFYPVKIGRYIIYRLDSSLFKNFGVTWETKTFTVKDSVEEQFYDNSNRLSYKIVRYKLDGIQWVPENTFTVTPLENSLEYVENNLRIIKLVNPVVDKKNWMGNSYISVSPFFQNSDYKTWAYTYTHLGNLFKVNNQLIDSTITVMSFDSLINKPFYNKGYSSYAKGYEIYAKGIGKIYQDILNWEYQVFTTYYNCKWIKCVSNVCDTTAINCNMIKCDSIRTIPGNFITSCDTIIDNYYYKGHGVKLTLIDHN